MFQLVLLNSFFEKIIAAIKQADYYLFIQVNSHYTNSFFDTILPFIRNQNLWIPLYLFLLVLVFKNFGNKAWAWVAALVITLILTDQISSNLIKNLVARQRPCADGNLNFSVRLLLNNCSGGYSFTSSHATNHFGVAVFIATTLKNVLGKWRYFFFAWAAVISYAQIYVGVHYPFDVLCGALLGCTIGYAISKLYVTKFNYFTLTV